MTAVNLWGERAKQRPCWLLRARHQSRETADATQKIASLTTRERNVLVATAPSNPGEQKIDDNHGRCAPMPLRIRNPSLFERSAHETDSC